ncbi:hypothetical protein DRN69_01465 [Candidatus Pacearchaeota archaeon]|nr:MAG: hypothetical protein DRN69_01465 [Candidatus Pacearchaeota archaeon]
MDFSLGPYIKKDLKHIKIRSAEEDIENHYKIFRGKIEESGNIEEIKNPCSVPSVNFLYETIIEGIVVYFFKDRCATTNPKRSPRQGLRIIFALFIVNKKPVKYVPFIVFLAEDEGKRYIAPNRKRYQLTSSFFKHIIEAKLKYL